MWFKTVAGAAVFAACVVAAGPGLAGADPTAPADPAAPTTTVVPAAPSAPITAAAPVAPAAPPDTLTPTDTAAPSVAAAPPIAAGPTDTGTPTDAVTPTAAAPAPPAQAAAPTDPAAPSTPMTSIDADGSYAVNTQLVPGVYSTPGPTDGGTCYWKRSGPDGATIDNSLTKKPQTVQVAPTDRAFKTNGCQPWSLTDAAVPAAQQGMSPAMAGVQLKLYMAQLQARAAASGQPPSS